MPLKQDLTLMTCKELREELKKHDLSSAGLKYVLVERLSMVQIPKPATSSAMSNRQESSLPSTNEPIGRSPIHQQRDTSTIKFQRANALSSGNESLQSRLDQQLMPLAPRGVQRQTRTNISVEVQRSRPYLLRASSWWLTRVWALGAFMTAIWMNSIGNTAWHHLEHDGVSIQAMVAVLSKLHTLKPMSVSPVRSDICIFASC